MTILSIFGGGLWFIPLIILIAALYSFKRGYEQHQSGSVDNYGYWNKNIKVPFWKCPATIFGYILTAISIAVLILMIADK